MARIAAGPRLGVIRNRPPAELAGEASAIGVRVVILFSQMKVEDPEFGAKLDQVRAEFPLVGLSHAYKPHLEQETIPILECYRKSGYPADRPATVDLLIPQSGNSYGFVTLAKKQNNGR